MEFHLNFRNSEAHKYIFVITQDTLESKKNKILIWAVRKNNTLGKENTQDSELMGASLSGRKPVSIQ